jgi:hypothetical protein
VSTVVGGFLPNVFVAFRRALRYLNIAHGVSIIAGIVLLVVAALVFTAGRQDQANFLGILVYSFLVIGVILARVVWRRDAGRENETEGESNRVPPEVDSNSWLQIHFRVGAKRVRRR